jgi:hypothetical protein
VPADRQKVRLHVSYDYSQNKVVSLAHPPVSAPSKNHAGGGSSGSVSNRPHAGAYKDRQRRADFNALKRSGDWDALEVPIFMLWLEDELLEDALMY